MTVGGVYVLYLIKNITNERNRNCENIVVKKLGVEQKLKNHFGFSLLLKILKFSLYFKIE